MKRPLATLMTLVIVSTLLIGFTAGPAAAVEFSAPADDCTSTATSTNAGSAVGIVIPQQGSIQVNLANNVQTGTAIALDGDATVTQESDLDQTNLVDQDLC